jgi:general secretion pathway protein M
MKQFMQEIRKRYWDQRPQQEQKLLKWLALMLVPLLAFFVLWLPAHQEVRKLQGVMKVMSMQAERLRGQADEIQMLRHRPKPAVLDAAAMKSAVEESATRQGLHEAITALELQQPNAVRITFASVAFDQWLRWMRALQQEQHVRADSLSVSLLPQPGMVKINATLINGGEQ